MKARRDYIRESRERKQKRGDCINCPRPALEGTRRCAPCARKHRLKQQARWRAKHPRPRVVGGDPGLGLVVGLELPNHLGED